MDIRINLVRVSPETRETIKRQVVNLYQNGYKAKKIGEILCISEYAARRIIDAYKEEGMGGVKEATRGRKEGEKRILSAKQEKKIQGIIIDKNPDQLKLPFALWTRAAVAQLIHDKYGIDVSLRTISNYLKRWGMTCQRPAKRAYRQDAKKLKEFME